MKQQETTVQKEQNVKKIILFVGFIFLINATYSQTKIIGTYYEDNNPSYLVDGGESTYYSFYENGIFTRNTSGELAEIDYGKGHYFIKNDSLLLNYDLTELKTNDYHSFKYSTNYNDSIQVKITIRDVKNKPLSGIRVLCPLINLYRKSDKDGIIKFSIKKKRQQIELHIDNNYLGYFFNIWTDKNYDVSVFLKNDSYAIPIKDQLSKYKILKISKEEIKLKTNSGFLLLKKNN